MSGNRFDDLSKALASGSPRRRFLQILAIGPLAGLVAHLGLHEDAEAQVGPGPVPGACQTIGQACPGPAGQPCCGSTDPNASTVRPAICEPFSKTCVACVTPGPGDLAACNACCQQRFGPPSINGKPVPTAPNPKLQNCRNDCICSVGPCFRSL